MMVKSNQQKMDVPDGAFFSRIPSASIEINLLSFSSGSPKPSSGNCHDKKYTRPVLKTEGSQHVAGTDQVYRETTLRVPDTPPILREVLRKKGKSGVTKTCQGRGEIKSETGYTLQAAVEGHGIVSSLPTVRGTLSLTDCSGYRHSNASVASTGDGKYEQFLNNRHVCPCVSEPNMRTVVQCGGHEFSSADAGDAVKDGGSETDRHNSTEGDESTYEFFQRTPYTPSVDDREASYSFLSPCSVQTVISVQLGSGAVPDLIVSNPKETSENFGLDTSLDKNNDIASNRSSMFYVSDVEMIEDTEVQIAVCTEQSPCLYPKLTTTDPDDETPRRNGVDHADSRTIEGIAFNIQSESPIYHQHPKQQSPNSHMVKEQEFVPRSKLKLIGRLILPIISLMIYVWDLGSDIKLAITYKENGDVYLFWITLACIVIPLALMSVVDVSWVWIDSSSCSTLYLVRYLLGALTLGRIVRAVRYMRHIVKSETLLSKEKRAWHQKRATEENRDCFMLDFINAFTESAPQLFVQMYLLYAFSLELSTIRVLNLLSSWFSIAWTYAAYYRCNREVLAGRRDVNIIGFLTFFLSVLAALAARVICVVLFLVYFRDWIGAVFLSVHFIVMLLCILLRDRPRFEGTTSSTFGRFLYCVFFAYVSILCFVNLQSTRARYRMILFYLIVYVENFTIAGFILYRIMNSEDGSNMEYNLLALPIGLVCHVTLLVIYYQALHPKTGKCFRVDLKQNTNDLVQDL